MAKANRHKDRGRAPEHVLQQKNRQQETHDVHTSKTSSLTASNLYSQPGLGVVAIVTGVLLAFALWKGLTVLDDVALAHTDTAKSKDVSVREIKENRLATIAPSHSYPSSPNISAQTRVPSLVTDLPLQDWNVSGLDLDLAGETSLSIQLHIPNAAANFAWRSPYGERSSVRDTSVIRNTVVRNTGVRNEAVRSQSQPQVVTETTSMKVTELIEEFERTQSIVTIKKLFDRWKENPMDSELMALWTGFLNRQGDIFVVESLYSQAHKNAPQNLLLHRQWARYYYDREEFNIASTILARIYNQAVSSEDIETLHLYAAAEAKLGSVFLAEEIYRHLSRMQPNEWRWVLALATVFDEAEDSTNSQVFYQQLLSYNNLPPEVESLVQKKLVAGQGY